MIVNCREIVLKNMRCRGPEHTKDSYKKLVFNFSRSYVEQVV